MQKIISGNRASRAESLDSCSSLFRWRGSLGKFIHFHKYNSGPISSCATGSPSWTLHFKDVGSEIISPPKPVTLQSPPWKSHDCTYICSISLPPRCAKTWEDHSFYSLIVSPVCPGRHPGCKCSNSASSKGPYLSRPCHLMHWVHPQLMEPIKQKYFGLGCNTVQCKSVKCKLYCRADNKVQSSFTKSLETDIPTWNHPLVQIYSQNSPFTKQINPTFPPFAVSKKPKSFEKS